MIHLIQSTLTITAKVTYELIGYKSQIVAGVNYFCKLKVIQTNTFVHARIYMDFSGNYYLDGVEEGHTIDDEIAYF